MGTFIILFFRSLTFLIGIQILSEDKLGVKGFGILLLMIQGIGYFLFQIIGILGIIFVIIFVRSFLFLKTKKILMSLIIPSVPIIFLILSDYVAKFILIQFIGVPCAILSEKPFFVAFIVLLNICVTTVLCSVVRWGFEKLRIYRLVEGRFGMLTTVFLMLTLIIFYVNLFINHQQGLSRESIRINSMLFLIYTSLLFVVFIVLSYVVFKDSEMEKERTQNQRLQEYMKQLEFLYENISTFRHDYLNVLRSLEVGIQNENIKEIKNVYERLVVPSGEAINGDLWRLTQLRNLQVDEVKSILAIKFIEAQSKNIEVELEIRQNIDEIYMDLVDFYRVFSILLDNAIEATIESRQPSLLVTIIQECESQRIIIENSCHDAPINLQEIFEKGYSSKGENRGIGLYTVRKLLNKNAVVLETTYKTGWFTQEIRMTKRGDYN